MKFQQAAHEALYCNAARCGTDYFENRPKDTKRRGLKASSLQGLADDSSAYHAQHSEAVAGVSRLAYQSCRVSGRCFLR